MKSFKKDNSLIKKIKKYLPKKLTKEQRKKLEIFKEIDKIGITNSFPIKIIVDSIEKGKPILSMENDFIECKEGVCGGNPVIKGTRIEVSIIIEKMGLDKSIKKLLSDYPHLKKEQILEALKFYCDNKNWIDSLIKQNKKIEKDFLKKIYSIPIIKFYEELGLL